MDSKKTVLELEREVESGITKEDYRDRQEPAEEVMKKYESLLSYEDGETLEDAKRKNAEKERWDRLGAAMKVIADEVNRGNARDVAEALYVGLSKQHRTLQQQSVNALVKLFGVYQYANFDPRNKAAVIAAAKISKFVDAAFITFPFI